MNPKSEPITFEALRRANTVRAVEWNPASLDRLTDLLFRATELGGETGEALNIIKKMARSKFGVPGGDEHGAALAEELADVVICVDRIAELIGLDLGEATRRKFNKTSDKHGFKTHL